MEALIKMLEIVVPKVPKHKPQMTEVAVINQSLRMKV